MYCSGADNNPQSINTKGAIGCSSQCVAPIMLGEGGGERGKSLGGRLKGGREGYKYEIWYVSYLGLINKT